MAQMPRDEGVIPPTGDSVPVSDSLNGTRYLHLLVNVGQDVVRRLFQHCCGSNKDEDLRIIVQKNQNELNKVLIKFQLKILERPSFDKLDFSLMFKLFTTIFPDKIGYKRNIKATATSRTTLHMALEKLRLQRNTIAHSVDLNMTDRVLFEEWDKARDAILYIADYLGQLDYFRQEVDKVQRDPLDKKTASKNEELIDKLKKLREEVLQATADIETVNVFDTLHTGKERFEHNLKSCNEKTKRFLEKAETDSKFYVKTSAFTNVEQILREKKHVVITGRKGAGKTELARQLLLRYMEIEETKVHVLANPSEDISDIKKYVHNVIFIDDICSSKDKVSDFNKYAGIIEQSLGFEFETQDSTHHITLIMTAREQHLEKARLECAQPSVLLSRECSVDLTSHLSPREKLDIIEKKISQACSTSRKTVNFQEDMLNCIPSDFLSDDFPFGFPYIVGQFSKKFAKEQDFNTVQFFLNEMSRIFQNDAKLAIFVYLALCDDEKQHTLSSIVSNHEKYLGFSVPGRLVRQAANAFEFDETFLFQDENETFKVTNDCVKEASKLLFIKSKFQDALNILQLHEVLDNIVVGLQNTGTGIETTYTHVTRRDDKLVLVDSIYKEIEGNVKLEKVFDHAMWTDVEFVDLFIEKKKHTDFCFVSSVLSQAVHHGQCILVEKILQVKPDGDVIENRLSESLLVACKEEVDMKVVKLLVEHGANVSYKCHHDSREKLKSDSPLEMAIVTSQEQKLKYLLEKEALIPDLKSWRFWTLLHRAAECGDTLLCNLNFMSMLARHDNEQSLNERDRTMFNLAKISFNASLEDFFYSCIQIIGMDDVLLEAFVKEGLQSEIEIKRKSKAFHLAVMGVNDHISETQISRTVDALTNSFLVRYINLENKNGHTPLRLAIDCERDVRILKSIIIGMSRTKVEKEEIQDVVAFCINSKLKDDFIADVCFELLECFSGHVDRKSAIELAGDKGANRFKTLTILAGNRKLLKNTDCTPLHTCLQMNLSVEQKLQLIHSLVNKDFNIDERGKNGQTPLMLAFHHYSEDMTRLLEGLIKLGADVNAMDNSDNSLLHYWFSSDCDDGQLEAIFAETDILKCLKTQNTENNSHMTPIMLAAKSTKTKAMESLLRMDVDLAKCDEDGNNIFHLLVQSKRSDNDIHSLVRLCISKVTIDQLQNAENKSGETPLLLSIQTHSSEFPLDQTIQYLIQHQNHWSHKDKQGKGMMQYCVESKLSEDRISELSTLILKNTDDEQSLRDSFHILAECEMLKVKQLPIIKQKLGDHRFIVEGSKIILHMVCGEGDPELTVPIINALLDSGIDINQVIDNETGESALACSVICCIPEEIITVLLGKGADIMAKDSQDANVLHLCLRSQREREDMNSLLRLLADKVLVNEMDRSHLTPLMEAAKDGNVTAVQILLDKGANVQAKDRAGKTALHHCIEADLPDETVCDTIDCLIYRSSTCEKPCSKSKPQILLIDKRDNMELTPLMYACSCDSRSRIFTILKLLQMKCNIQTVDENGESPIHNVLQWLVRHDIMSEIERLTRLMLLQLYGCDTASKNDEGKLPRNICDQNHFEMERRMLQQRHSPNKLKEVLFESITVLKGVEGDFECEQYMYSYNDKVEIDEIIDVDVKQILVFIAERFHDLNFNKQENDAYLSDSSFRRH